MHLRELKLDDAPLMLEWMHDKDIVENMHADFASKTMEDCITFINASKDDKKNVHRAIADENDNYMGTVSLKNISDDSAEFGIAVRSKAMSKGYSQYGMNQIVDYGFKECGLKRIFWCVDSKNKRALKFYDKSNFRRVSFETLEIDRGVRPEEIQSFTWYQITESDWKENSR